MPQVMQVTETTKIRTPKFIMPDGVAFSSNPIEFEIEHNLDHRADPIKNLDDIIRISDYFVERKMWKYNLMFIMGINFGLRIGDLLKLRVGNIITEDFEYRVPIEIREQKRRKTRKLYVNEAVSEAFGLYLSHKKTVDLNDYLFEGYRPHTQMTRQSVDKCLRKVKANLNLPYNCGTHIFRKTFSYWVLATAEDKQRSLYYLQKILNHSDSTTTLFYAGITDDEIFKINMSLNLGIRVGNVLNPGQVFDMEKKSEILESSPFFQTAYEL